MRRVGQTSAAAPSHRTSYPPRPAPLGELTAPAAFRSATSATPTRPSTATRSAGVSPLRSPYDLPTPENDPAGWVAQNLFDLDRNPHAPLLDATLLPPAWELSEPTFDGVAETPIAQITPALSSPKDLGFEKPIYRGQSPAPRPGEGSADGWDSQPVVTSVAPSPVVTADGEFNPFQTVRQSGFDVGQGTANPLLPQSPNGGPFQGTFREPPPFEEPPGFVDIDVPRP